MPACKLSLALEKDIRRLCALGQSHFEYGEPEVALETLLQAWQLMPEPRTGSDTSALLLAMIGDCYLYLERDLEARQAFSLALQCGETEDDPLLRVRLGAACRELDLLYLPQKHPPLAERFAPAQRRYSAAAAR